jgi:hypothetical protein
MHQFEIFLQRWVPLYFLFLLKKKSIIMKMRVYTSFLRSWHEPKIVEIEACMMHTDVVVRHCRREEVGETAVLFKWEVRLLVDLLERGVQILDIVLMLRSSHARRLRACVSEPETTVFPVRSNDSLLCGGFPSFFYVGKTPVIFHGSLCVFNVIHRQIFLQRISYHG